jgi:hypothetical protein
MFDHNEFHRMFFTKDSDFMARWRQWKPGDKVDFDPCQDLALAQAVVKDWLALP